METFSKQCFPFVTQSWTKWYWMSICLYRIIVHRILRKSNSSKTIAQHDWSRIRIVCRNVQVSWPSQSALVASDTTTYSASVIDVVVHSSVSTCTRWVCVRIGRDIRVLTFGCPDTRQSQISIAYVKKRGMILCSGREKMCVCVCVCERERVETQGV